MVKDSRKQLVALWKKASMAMQDYYRGRHSCYGQGENCQFNAHVMHHHLTWKAYIPLRFEPSNLVPLCATCHNAYHNGDEVVRQQYYNKMADNHGNQWLANLYAKDRNHVKKSNLEWIDALKKLIEYYEEHRYY